MAEGLTLMAGQSVGATAGGPCFWGVFWEDFRQVYDLTPFRIPHRANRCRIFLGPRHHLYSRIVFSESILGLSMLPLLTNSSRFWNPSDLNN